MRNVFIIILLASNLYHVSAKNFVLKFATETISYKDTSIVVNRLTSESYSKAIYTKESSIDVMAMKFYLFEGKLKENQKKVSKNYPPTESISQKDMDEFESFFNKNDFSKYRSEIDFYNKIKLKINDENRRLRDSVDIATAINKKMQDSINNAKIEQNKYLEDSVKYKNKHLSPFSDMENSVRIAHKYATTFSDMNFNFVNMRVQDFMADYGYLYFGESNISNKGKNKILTESYIKYSQSEKPEKINFSYTLRIDSERDLVIEKCVITGNTVYLLDFFISFFPTTVHIDDIKNKKIAYCYYMWDRIDFIYDNNGDFKIVIAKNKQINIKIGN